MVIPRVEDPDCVVSPTTFMTDVSGRVIRSVQLQFRRKPLLVESAETSGTTSASAVVGTVQTSVFAATADVPSPTRLEIGNSTLTGAIASGLVIVTEDQSGSSDALVTAQASTAGAGGAYGVVNSAASFAFATNVLRYTPTGTTRVASGNITGFSTIGTLLLVLEHRNNTSGKEYVVDVELRVGNKWVRSRGEVIGGTSTAAGYTILGIVSATATVTAARLGIQASSTGGSIEFDRLIMARVDAVRTHVIQHGALASIGAGQYLHISPRYLAELSPLVWLEGSGAFVGTREYPETLDSNPLVLTRQVNIRTIWLAYDGTVNWAVNTGAARYQVNTRARRQIASLTPR